jgi:hypothetical protein
MMMFLGAISSGVPRDVLTPPAVPEGDGDGPLGLVLPDDVLVQLRNDFPRSQISDGMVSLRLPSFPFEDSKRSESLKDYH